MKFTLVSTIFNEANRLQLTIDDLKNQSCQPDEVVITDAGSTDGTIELVKSWQDSVNYPIKLFIKPKCNVAEGRNYAIRNSSHNIIVSTDFGCRFHKDWLKSMIEPFKNENTLVVCGMYTVIEEDQLTLPAKAAYIMNKGYTANIASDSFIPSSRSIAYKKEVFYQIGGYCEWLTLAADDSVFGMELLKKGFKLHKVYKPFVYWGRHSSFTGFKKEAFRYGLGEGEAQIGTSQLIKNLIQIFCRFTAAVLLLVISILLVIKVHFIFLYILFLISLAIGGRQYFQAILKPWFKFKSQKYDFEVLFGAIYLFELTQVNFLKGYIKGYFFSNENVKSNAKALAARLTSEKF